MRGIEAGADGYRLMIRDADPETGDEGEDAWLDPSSFSEAQDNWDRADIINAWLESIEYDHEVRAEATMESVQFVYGV